MDKLTGNEFAMPQGDITLSGTVFTKGGLTIRQKFASEALQGLLAGRSGGSSFNIGYVELAVKYADNLIDELNK